MPQSKNVVTASCRVDDARAASAADGRLDRGRRSFSAVLIFNLAEILGIAPRRETHLGPRLHCGIFRLIFVIFPIYPCY